eukprot:2600363-Alexandrium_andersonii.AAC.1
MPARPVRVQPASPEPRSPPLDPWPTRCRAARQAPKLAQPARAQRALQAPCWSSVVRAHAK